MIFRAIWDLVPLLFHFEASSGY